MAECHYEVPKWAGKPPVGYHLDVLKDSKLIQKLMIDEKKCYLFGRNPNLNDFCIDHASCSRVHAALVYHRHLERAFLVDLGSTHGTFIGSVRIEANKPTQLPVDSIFHFGASTRHYVLREKPNQVKTVKSEMSSELVEDNDNCISLPEGENELNNLTEYNTAYNKRISILNIDENSQTVGKKRKLNSVTFKEEEDIINPEDIDPTIGKFRNLVQTSIIPKRKMFKLDTDLMASSSSHTSRILRPDHSLSSSSLNNSLNPLISSSLSLKLGLHLPNPAPDIDKPDIDNLQTAANVQNYLAKEHFEQNLNASDDNEDDGLPKKKKYAKEAWPGRKPSTLLTI